MDNKKKTGRKHAFRTLLLTGILVLGGLAGCSRQDSLFMEVGQYPVTVEEYAMQAYDNISKTALQYSQKGFDVNRKAFWSEKIDGKTPMDTIKELTDSDVIRDKGIQILALKYGLTDDISYEGFLEDFEEENKLRKKKQDQGEVIYGPVRLSIEQYYSYRQGQWEQAVKELVEKQEITVSEQDLKDYYEMIAPIEGRKNFRLKALAYQWEGEEESLEQRAAELAAEAGVTAEGARILSVETGIPVEVNEIFLNTLEMGKEYTDANRLLEALAETECGEVSQRFWRENGLSAVALVTEKDYVPFGTFEETRAYVEQRYKEEQAEAWIENRLSEFQVKTGMLYENLTYEQLNP